MQNVDIVWISHANVDLGDNIVSAFKIHFLAFNELSKNTIPKLRVDIIESNYNWNGNYNNNSIGVRPSLLVAARYFFTPNIGVYSELGYDISIIKAGLSVKFGGK